MTAFDQIISANYGKHEARASEILVTSAYVRDAADSLAEYVRSIGDARTDKGWNFS